MMRKRSTRCKTYGRAAVSSQVSFDFDRVFKSVADGNGTGSSPFNTSDSSAGKSTDNVDFSRPVKQYNFRKNHVDYAEKDSESDHDILDGSSIAQHNMTPSPPAFKPTSQRNRDKGRRNGRARDAKKELTKQRKTPDLNEKENIPDYDAIAEDSLVIESESSVGITKCSTPVANSVDSLDLLNGSGKMPTPISRVFRSAKFGGTEDETCNLVDNVLTSDAGLECEDDSTYVTRRRSSKIHNKLLTRKIVLDKDWVTNVDPVNSSLLNGSLCSNNSDNGESVLYSLKSVHEKSSLSLNHTFDTTDELLKSIRENISKIASINLSLDGDVMTKNASPSQDLPDPSFDVSDDLFQSHNASNNNDGLSCICEENEESKSLLNGYSTYEMISHNISDHKHLSDSFYDKLVTHSICEKETQTAQKKLMIITEQDDYISFHACIPSNMMSKCVKIGEGVYGEVFSSVSRSKNVAIKIIPIEGNFNVNDCPQKTFDEILPEAVIAKELSDLATGQYNSNFCQVNRISCVQSDFPEPLLRQWDEYAKRKVSENDRPDIFPNDQLFVVFEFIHGGTALENFELTNHRQALSVLRQVVYALAVAESTHEFEHRDLHIGNVLVRTCQDANVKFLLHEEEIEFPTEGVFATIIDFTISRLKKDGCAVFCDVSTDDGLFEGSGDFQFDVYRDMKKANENDWSKFCPYTNVLWVHYLCRKLMTVIKIKDKGREYRDSQRRLRQLNDCIHQYESCFHMAVDNALWKMY